MRRVQKQFSACSNGPCARLPSTLPTKALETYKKLWQYVHGLRDAERVRLSALNVSLLEVTASSWAGGTETTTKWLVAQRFDAHRVAQATACEAVPVCGIAVPLNCAPVRGTIFCFLPVGDIATGLPVHVNGCFEVQDNRRNLWLDDGGERLWFVVVHSSIHG